MATTNYVIKGTLDTGSVKALDSGTLVTYLGHNPPAGHRGLMTRFYKLTSSATNGTLSFTIDRSTAVESIKLFRQDGTALTVPTGYSSFGNIIKNGKGKGVVAATTSGAGQVYIVQLNFEGYSAEYSGSVKIA